MSVIEAAPEVSCLPQGAEVTQNCSVEGEETLWSAAVACGSPPCPGNVGTVDPVPAGSVPCALPVSKCLLPAVWGLLSDVHLQKCPVPLVFVLSRCVCRVWGLCGVRQPILALRFVHPSLTLSGSSRHCHLASLQVLPSTLSYCFCRT